MSTDSNRIELQLHEWQTIGPSEEPGLRWESLNTVLPIQSSIPPTPFAHRLKLVEQRYGLQIETKSYVGRVRLGGLELKILPKLSGDYLLPLLRYAYGFRRLELLTDTSQGVSDCGFEDLLVHQLNAEVRELIAGGLMRSYVSRSDRLSSPRGRIDVARLARAGEQLAATLPCIHHLRVEDTLPNRILRAGLELAATIASDLRLRRESRRLASQLVEQVSSIRLSTRLLDRSDATRNRLFAAYEPAMVIIRLLHEARGIALDNYDREIQVSGFLFDMNSWFQAVLSRFLHENLLDYRVQDERSLRGMVRYNPEFHRPNRPIRVPRPDFAVSCQEELVSILDAKYRDLWQHELPRSMLYQLVVYAMSHSTKPGSVILYPAADPTAQESRIDVTDPQNGKFLAQVALRPIHLPSLVDLIHAPTPQGNQKREAFAQYLAIK